VVQNNKFSVPFVHGVKKCAVSKVSMCFGLKYNLIYVNFHKKRNFVVAGSQTMSYQDKYSVLVVQSGYVKFENLEIKIYGKLNDGTRYENIKTVTIFM